MSSKKAEAIKINNRKAAHSQHPQVLRTKRQGSGKGGWGDPMDDLKYLNQDAINDPNDPNYEEEIEDAAYPQTEEVEQGAAAQLQQQQSEETNDYTESDYFQNFQSDVESLAAFKIKVEDLVNEFFMDKDEDKFTSSLIALNCPNFFNQVPKVLIWTVIASKKQENFPATRTLLMHLRSTETVSKVQLESSFRRLFHRLNELSMENQNAYIILVDFGEYCVARNLMDEEFLSQLKKQTEFAKDPQRIERLKKHIQEILEEFFTSGDIEEAVRCVAEMDTPFYTHEVVKRIISTAFDKGNRERELTSQFLARAVGDSVLDIDYPIPRKNAELGFIILLQRVEGLYKDVPDVLELLSSFIGRCVVDEVLPPNFLEHVDLLQTDMGYAVINHVKHLLSGSHARYTDKMLNVWGANSSKSIDSMKKAIQTIIKEYLISRELDEALTAIQELNIPMFHHEIIKQLIPAVADYYVAKDIQQQTATQSSQKYAKSQSKEVIVQELNIPNEIADKAIQIQLAVDLVQTALQHNIMSAQQIDGGFKRLRERLDDYKLDSPLITKYYQCIADQFKHVLNGDKDEEKAPAIKAGGAQTKSVDDEDVKEIVTQSKELVVEHAKKNNVKLPLDAMSKYEAVECKTQTVAGINYFLKVRISEKQEQYIHVFVWRKLDKSLELLGVEYNQSKSDALVYRRQPSSSYASAVSASTQQPPPSQGGPRRVGGLKDGSVDERVQTACAAVREQVTLKAQQEKKNLSFQEFTPVSVKTQVVAGINLFVKVKVDTNKYIHIRVWCRLDRSIELSAVQWDKSENDEIEYF
eukprot:CAMPEP_0197037724 /NCGR_PEP_ID=MMETSP1384-20130603/14858_1 /TAXON_ID=29189 /ORGANISM="Ammonia sp." /LENGTH=807 /DNA_ID=CAMNT_0042468071 /DNA_START=23 /DNA_END=2446 /DNA_ORIENTATION=-